MIMILGLSKSNSIIFGNYKSPHESLGFAVGLFQILQPQDSLICNDVWSIIIFLLNLWEIWSMINLRPWLDRSKLITFFSKHQTQSLSNLIVYIIGTLTNLGFQKAVGHIHNFIITWGIKKVPWSKLCKWQQLFVLWFLHVHEWRRKTYRFPSLGPYFVDKKITMGTFRLYPDKLEVNSPWPQKKLSPTAAPAVPFSWDPIECPSHRPMILVPMINLIWVNFITTSRRSPEPWNHGFSLGKSSPFVAARFRLVKYHKIYPSN